MKSHAHSPFSRRNFLLLLLIIALIAGGWLYFSRQPSAPGGMGGGMGGPGMMGGGMATPVQAGVAKQADVPVYLSALGTVVPNASVTVTSRVDGQLMKVYFTEGQQVEAGQLLAQIDPRSYQATLAQYQGALAENQALLKSAQLTLARYKTLYAQDSLSRQDLETQTATVGQYLGTIKADQAQIEAAKLNLEYTRITAPVSGRVGLRLVDAGNMVHSSDTTGIVTLTQTQPIAATFSVPQASLQTVLKPLHRGETLPATAIDQDGSSVLAQGKLSFISNEIDTATGSIKLKALFDNQDEQLYPNQFVNIRLQTTTLKNAVVIPAQALQLSSDGDFVYLVNKDNTVTRKAVKSGPAFGNTWQAILSGVAAGDRVVTTGIDRLQDGAKVRVVTAQAASTGATPATGGQPATATDKKAPATDAASPAADGNAAR
ncbi:MdtA/MuxA family multidrug efflux RND transporter periplasmic adaptor subunit [Nissabacter archeti]|uniref:MdtA/MuxA family multidrug efflux RND transporter periplasmic adaptor subunit n=1 Tax=Nissabacter archeti TaxID=1917880 RepID=UPI0009A20B40|nr:MdtA/MuxA family multidrug efflux RND transporter periplasmic adaptor subunit [Nissabacter archeti]